MIIDFHTHAFPDSLAPKAMDTLLEHSYGQYQPVSDGTISGLTRNMDAWGIDASVMLPVVTKASQVKSTNEWVSGNSSQRIIGFGGIYPHSDDYRRDIDFVAGLGLRGLKFHAEYQDFVLDDDSMLKIYDYALSKGLIILHHAGYDPAFPEPFRSDPKRFANMLSRLGGGTIIAAHLGGHAQWDAVEEHLVGKDIYFDTSMGFEYFPPDQFLRIVKNHGAHKLLFASDAPWSCAKTEIEHIRALPLSEGDKSAILGGNAQRLLGL